MKPIKGLICLNTLQNATLRESCWNKIKLNDFKSQLRRYLKLSKEGGM